MLSCSTVADVWREKQYNEVVQHARDVRTAEDRLRRIGFEPNEQWIETAFSSTCELPTGNVKTKVRKEIAMSLILTGQHELLRMWVRRWYDEVEVKEVKMDG